MQNLLGDRQLPTAAAVGNGANECPRSLMLVIILSGA